MLARPPRGSHSTLIFIMVLEYLSKLTVNAVEESRLDLYKMGGVMVESNLAFVDDMVFFMRQVVHHFA